MAHFAWYASSIFWHYLYLNVLTKIGGFFNKLFIKKNKSETADPLNLVNIESRPYCRY